jgi:hypothetical protein
MPLASDTIMFSLSTISLTHKATKLCAAKQESNNLYIAKHFPIIFFILDLFQ